MAPTTTTNSAASIHSSHSTETTPLLAGRADEVITEETQEVDRKKSGRWQRWPSALALGLLCVVVIIIMIAGFLAPQAVREYATEALVFEPTNLSIDSFTASGVKARIQGDFTLDASRVKNRPARNLGRFITSIAKKVELGPSLVEVSLPEYGNLILGKADVPGITIDIRNGHTTHLDFVSELTPGSKEGISRLAEEWLDGKIKHLRLRGETNVEVKSGRFSLGSHSIVHYQELRGKDIPSMPKYNISRSVFDEIKAPGQSGLEAKASLHVVNDYPLDFVLPALNFAIYVDNCSPNEAPIKLADAKTPSIHLEPKKDLDIKVAGIIHHLPEAVLKRCPGSEVSPLDSLLGEYIQGRENTVYVRGSNTPSADTPKWLADLLSQLTVPVPFPGHAFGRLVKDFSLTNVHLELPQASGEANSTAISPKVSADVRALVVVPEEVNFPLEVHRFKGAADVYYHGEKLGYLDLDEWRPAKSHPVKNNVSGHVDLQVISRMDKVPMTITNEDVFVGVVQDLLHSNDTLLLTVKADVDVALRTSLGEFVVRKIPTVGEVPIQPLAGANYASFNPRIDDLDIAATTPRSITLKATMNFTNPTPYTATLPFADVSILVNGTELGHAIAEAVTIKPGFNAQVPVTAVWNPYDASGSKGAAVGKELLSQYISGFNTTITLRTHAGTFPAHPSLGKALRVIAIEMPTPNLKPVPGHEGNNDSDSDSDSDSDDDDDGGGGRGSGSNGDKPHFIEDATMHLLTSRAQFTLLSPLPHTPLHLTTLNATAYYRSSPVGSILHQADADGEGEIDVPPGASQTPKLPVSWNLGSVGYRAVRRALGGRLRLEARAVVGVRIGAWREEVWFVGRGIGVGVRI